MNNNQKINPLLLIIIIIISLNVLGFVLRMFFQFAGIALLVLIVYLIWQNVVKKR